MTDYPTLDLTLISTWHDEQCYVDGSEAWLVSNLWEAAKDLPEYDVPLIGLDTDLVPWDGVGDDFMEFLSHCKLINDADLSFPIIMTPKGAIADGRHRLAKAIINGHTTIKIKRLPFMPVCDYEYDDEGNTI